MAMRVGWSSSWMCWRIFLAGVAGIRDVAMDHHWLGIVLGWLRSTSSSFLLLLLLPCFILLHYLIFALLWRLWNILVLNRLTIVTTAWIATTSSSCRRYCWRYRCWRCYCHRSTIMGRQSLHRIYIRIRCLRWWWWKRSSSGRRVTRGV